MKNNASKSTFGCQDFTAKRRFAPLLLAALLGDIPPETVASTIQPPARGAMFDISYLLSEQKYSNSHRQHQEF